MTKTFKISIPKFLEKQKKLDGKRQFIRIDTDMFFDSKVAALKPYAKLLYLFILTRLDENGETFLSEKYIRKALDFSRNINLECLLNALSLLNLCTFVAQKDNKKTKNQQRGSKNASTIYKDVLKKENKEKKETDFDFEKGFSELWNKYPNKDGKKQALTHFKSTVKTSEDFKAINIALDNYLKSEKVKKGFIKNGSTWFNNWQDWINIKPEMTLLEEKKASCRVCKGNGFTTYRGVYACGFCDQGIMFAGIGKYSTMPEGIKEDIENQLQEVA